MAKVNTKLLCKKENADEFFKRLLSGDKIQKTINDKTYVVANKNKIYFDDLFSIEFYEFKGDLYASLGVKTLQDRKAIKEHINNKGDL